MAGYDNGLRKCNGSIGKHVRALVASLQKSAPSNVRGEDRKGCTSILFHEGISTSVLAEHLRLQVVSSCQLKRARS